MSESTTMELPAIECEKLSITTKGVERGVDKDARIVRGFVVAQLGAFRTQGRGEFDEKSLRQIVRLMKSDPDGLPSYWKHPTQGSPDQLGNLLGRAKHPRIETIKAMRSGEVREVQAVLADLHLNPTAFENNPNGNIGQYVLELADSDPRAFGTSLVLEAAKEHRLHRGRQVLDDSGNPLPPLWRPLELNSIDVVGRGEAVDSFLPAMLSASQDFFSILDSAIAGDDREAVRSSASAIVERYLSYRFGGENNSEAEATEEIEALSADPIAEAVVEQPTVNDDGLLLDLYLIDQG